MAAKEEKAGNAIIETIKTVVYALLIAGVFRTLFFQPFWIPSGSMKETLLVGDFLFVNKMAYGYSYASCPSIILPRFGVNVDAKDICGFLDGDNSRFLGSEPERGDVIVFRHPVTGRDYIKRLIGLPGDTIQMRNGLVFINGQAAPQEPAGTFSEVMGPQGPEGRRPRCSNGPVGDGGECLKDRYVETLPNGVQHVVLDIAPQSSDSTGEYTVRAGHYFFMGDNRDNSADSRLPQQVRGVGEVPFENLIGRADRVMFSSGGRSMLFFWDLARRSFFQEGRVKLAAELRDFQGRLGHQFKRPELLAQAVTHASMSSANRDDNQRMEFLGDRVLGLVMAEALLALDHHATEGQLAPRFNALVRKETCADVAREIDLGAVLRLGRSEMLSGGRRKQALLGDAIEAVIAAVYLDAGFDAAKDLILRLWGQRLHNVAEDARDAKTALQEWAQARGLQPPRYEETRRDGPDHAPLFTIVARLSTGESCAAQAGSKRQAEQAAAQALLAKLEETT